MLSLEARLNKVPWLSEPYSVSSFSINTSNANYRLIHSGCDYFVKDFQATNFAAIDRLQAFDLQSKISELGLATKPCFLYPELYLLIEEWKPTQKLLSAVNSTSEKLQSLANALAAIHNIDVSASRLNLPQHWRHYLAQIEGSKKAQLKRVCEQLSDIWQETTEYVLCHHDLSFSHVSCNPKNLIYDWEYVALSNRYFDIACCILINQLDEAEEGMLLQYYSDEQQMMHETLCDKVTAMKPLAELTAELWYLAQAN